MLKVGCDVCLVYLCLFVELYEWLCVLWCCVGVIVMCDLIWFDMVMCVFEEWGWWFVFSVWEFCVVECLLWEVGWLVGCDVVLCYVWGDVDIEFEMVNVFVVWLWCKLVVYVFFVWIEMVV